MQDFLYDVFVTKLKIFNLLILIPLGGFAQNSEKILPEFNAPKSPKISIEEVVLRIRDMKHHSPENYGKVVDYYYLKIASTGRNNWIEKLEEFSLDPSCEAKYRLKINAHIISIRTLQVGEKVPEITIGDFQLSNFRPSENLILMLFYSPSCFHCTELLIDLIPYIEKQNIAVVAIQTDDEMNVWKLPERWVQITANQKIRKEYGIYSTPSLILLNSKNQRICAIPESLIELKEFVKLL